MNNEATTANNLQPGEMVQYRKVGTARIIRQQGEMSQRTPGEGWYVVEFVKAPKKYREAGEQMIWTGPAARA